MTGKATREGRNKHLGTQLEANNIDESQGCQELFLQSQNYWEVESSQ